MKGYLVRDFRRGRVPVAGLQSWRRAAAAPGLAFACGDAWRGGATSRLCATHKNGARVRGHAGAWERGRGVQDTHALCERRRGDTGGSRAIARGHDALGL